MDRYCPECNSTMTPSLVGYLCSNCGGVQRFYTDTGPMPANPSPMPVHLSNPSPMPVHIANPLPGQPSEASSRVLPDNKLQATLKRLMVPEVPPPHSHEPSSGVDGIQCISGILDSRGPANNPSPTPADDVILAPMIAKNNSSTWILVGLIVMVLLAAFFIAYMLTVGAVTI